MGFVGIRAGTQRTYLTIIFAYTQLALSDSQQQLPNQLFNTECADKINYIMQHS